MITFVDAVRNLVETHHPNIGLSISGKCESDLSGVKLSDGSTLSFTFDDVLAKKKELENEYEKQAYARSRADAYDPIPEQLDQIYHDMDGWKKRIKAVKDKFPKP
mgnify:CR=1 FL=1|tara:strand:+ start:2408 stop:2722 length:315 start_codon:yes stop_codon:yes gene_type:complete